MRNRVLTIAICALAAPGLGAAGTITASNGAKIQHSAVGAMHCEEIQARLDEIDNTGYRQNSPTPQNEADQALYNYERKLSVAFYWRCAAQIDEENTDNGFDLGFSE